MLQFMGSQRVRHDSVTEQQSVCGGGLGAKSRLTLSDLTDCSPPGSSDRGISQARILEWVAISFSNILYIPGQITDPFLSFSYFSQVMGIITPMLHKNQKLNEVVSIELRD